MATSQGKGAPTVIQTEVATSKAAKAREIFSEMAGSPRKDVVQKFVAEAGLTEKGAATYYQNFRKEAGMVQSRVQPVQPPSGRAQGRR
jgi:hypothetical protein